MKQKGGGVRQRRGGWRVRQRGVGSGAKEGVESESGGLRVRQKGVESVIEGGTESRAEGDGE